MELLSYVIIGLATFLVVATVIFLTALHVWERIDAWRVEKAAPKSKRR